MKSIIKTLLLVAALVMTTGCSTEWEEFSYGQDVPSYSNDELSAMVTVHRDRAEITLPRPLTYYIYLDGVFIKQVTTTANDEKVVVRALTPDTEYHLLIKALDGEKVLTKEETFTTRLSYASVIGLVEMNYYDGEEMLDFVHQMPGGDFITMSP